MKKFDIEDIEVDNREGEEYEEKKYVGKKENMEDKEKDLMKGG